MKYTLLLLLFVASIAGAENKVETFTGEIGDSSCAYNVHSLSRSHKEMLKSGTFGKTAAECTRHCVKQFGASYVLVHNNDVYRFEQQDVVAPFAGHEVKITGSLVEDGKTIHIDKIEPAK